MGTLPPARQRLERAAGLAPLLLRFEGEAESSPRFLIVRRRPSCLPARRGASVPHGCSLRASAVASHFILNVSVPGE